VSALHGTAAHVQDTWRLSAVLTLSLGVRFDHFRSSLPPQSHPAGQSASRTWPETRVFDASLVSWIETAPRLGATYQITGDGRTLVKLSWGRYWLPPTTEVGFLANRNGRDWWELYDWIDDNRNGYWDPAEERRLRERRPSGDESIDPSLELSYVTESTLRISRELGATSSVDTGVVWRHERQPFARHDRNRPYDLFTQRVSLVDPGPDAVAGTSDDGRVMEVFDVPSSAETLPASSFVLRNVPAIGSRYLTWDVRARRRLHRRWSLVAGFSYMWVREHASVYLGQPVRTNTYPLTPNDLINTRPDGRHEFAVWSAQAYGTYEGPWGLRFSPFLRHQSGQPYGRTFLSRGLNIGPVRVLAEPVGARRMDHVTLVDLRIEKRIALGRQRWMALVVDGYNLLNANPEQNISWSSGQTAAGQVTFGRPLTIVPPRIARLGVTDVW
jgi:hypothetical protein